MSTLLRLMWFERTLYRSVCRSVSNWSSKLHFYYLFKLHLRFLRLLKTSPQWKYRMLFLAVKLKETRHLMLHGQRMNKDWTSQPIYDWLRLLRTIIILWQSQIFTDQTQVNIDVWPAIVSTLPLHLPPNWKYTVSIIGVRALSKLGDGDFLARKP